MRLARLTTALMLAFFCLSLHAQLPRKKITVTGTLSRVMAIGGESTGWSIQLDSAATIGDKEVHSIEVAYLKTAKLEKLENKHVQATGVLSHRQGVETGDRLVLEVSSLKAAGAQSIPAHPGSFSLPGSEWLLEDLAGSGVIDNVQATLAFGADLKVSGNTSCNRFFGSAEIHAESIKLSPLGSTRMACPQAVMDQEKKYLDALQAADHFEWKAPYLLINCKGYEKPLRFTRMATAKPPST